MIDLSGNEHTTINQDIADLLGALRAESLGDQVFEHFAEPEFFPELQSRNSVVLRGGRGTGKTTLLRCLSYQGQDVLRSRNGVPLSDWPFIGLFWRINTNRVTAFSGPELTPERWVKLFGHYVNLELTELIFDFLSWLESRDSLVSPMDESLDALAASLNISSASSVAGFRSELRKARVVFEARVNNIADHDGDLGLSMLGAPVDLLVGQLRESPFFRDKTLFFLIDEYENLLDYQQEVFNTLIKHSSDAYCFKVGVKEMGLRRRSTINPNEQLSSPADYHVVSIPEKLSPHFEGFAEQVVGSRLGHIAHINGSAMLPLKEMFQSLSLDEEATQLGVEQRLGSYRHMLVDSLRPADLALFDSLSPLQRYFVFVWTHTRPKEIVAAIKGLSSRNAGWNRRFANYSYPLLFGVRAGTSGRRKHYAGWHTVCRLAGANIRYLLELVAGMLQEHVRQGRTLAETISIEIQTDCAQEIGKKNLQELERDTDQAGSLIRLVLSLGRIFEVLAATPAGHTPEVTQFCLQSTDDFGRELGENERKVRDLLDEAVNAQALVRFPGSKLQRPSQTRDFDYMLHPIFAAFFVCSYRRKRKIELTEEEFLALVSEPRWAISRVLLRQQRDPSEVALPEQLRLFSSFYA